MKLNFFKHNSRFKKYFNENHALYICQDQISTPDLILKHIDSITDFEIYTFGMKSCFEKNISYFIQCKIYREYTNDINIILDQTMNNLTKNLIQIK